MSGKGIHCPGCGRAGETQVRDSRQTVRHGIDARWRRRQCACGHRWTTIELAQDDFDRLIALKDAARAYWSAVQALE